MCFLDFGEALWGVQGIFGAVLGIVGSMMVFPGAFLDMLAVKLFV